MNHQYVKTTRTRFNPCVIECLTKRNLFVVGTYELVEKDSDLAKKYSDLEARNYRLGTLELFESTSGEVVLQYECQFGGVFDLRLVQLPASRQPDEVDLLVVAHANGILALYQLRHHEVTLLSHWKTSSDMLTTVQDCSRNAPDMISFIAGGATGLLIQVHCKIPADLVQLDLLFNDYELTEDSITERQHPIWFIRTYQVQLGANSCDNLLFIGSEDSKWRVRSERLNDTIYTNNESKAGITSFEFLKSMPNSSETESASNSQPVTVLVGSYDEYLRMYRLVVSATDDQQADSSIPRLSIDSSTMFYKIHIEGGGIWRMKSFPPSGTNMLILLSAMYSGAYLLSFDTDALGELTNWSKCRTSCKSVHQLKLKGLTAKTGTLIYGIASTANLSTVLFASFYHKELFLFRQTGTET